MRVCQRRARSSRRHSVICRLPIQEARPIGIAIAWNIDRLVERVPSLRVPNAGSDIARGNDGSAAHFLALEGIIVLYALIVLAPVLLLGALAWWIVRERRRREERLLASA